MIRRMVLVLVGLLVLIALETRSEDLFNKKWSVNTHAVHFLQISKDGTKILSNNGTQTIIYDIQTGDTLKIFEGRGKFSEDGLYIINTKMVKDDNDSLELYYYGIDIYNYGNYEFVKSIVGSNKLKYGDNETFQKFNIYTSPKGNQLLINYGTALHFIDFKGKNIMDTNAFENRYDHTQYSVGWIQYSNDGSKLFVDRSYSFKGTGDGSIVSFNTTNFEKKYEIDGSKSRVSMSGINDILCYGNSRDNKIAYEIYETKNKQILKQFTKEEKDIYHLNLSHDQKYLAFMREGENLKILSFPDLLPKQEFVLSDFVFIKEFSKDGKYFAIGNNMTIDLYEIGTIGVEEKENNLEVIYPNPTNSQITIKFDLKKDIFLSIELFDMSGKLINVIKKDYYESGIQTETMDLNGINAGQYIIKINSVILNKSYKLVVTN